MKEETKKHIENVIKETYKILQNVYDFQQENKENKKVATGSRIILPKKRDNSTRLSEQELKFIFVEQLNKEIEKEKWDVYYSVETPTANKYKFNGQENPKVVLENEKGGQSARFDLVIHDNKFNRIALIEFKANNASVAHHEKDFLKLREEGTGEILTYFFEVVQGSDGGTEKSIAEKTKGFKGEKKCWSLQEKKDILCKK